MSRRRIPRNPNSPPPYHASDGIQSHWGRTLTMILIALGLLAVSRVLNPEPPRSVAPIDAVALPQLTPALAATPIVAEAVPQAERHELVRASVERANAAFSKARAQADPTQLRAAATGAWLAYEQRYIAGLRQRRQTERWRLRSLDLQGMLIRDASATVCTNEQWEVMVLDDRGNVVDNRSRTDVERYTLVWQEAGWMVSQIDYVENGCSV